MYKRDHDGPIGPMKESKNVFKLSKAVGLKKERSNEETTSQSSDPESSPRSKPASREGERNTRGTVLLLWVKGVTVRYCQMNY